MSSGMYNTIFQIQLPSGEGTLDAGIVNSIASGQAWSHGLDNSDSDAFAISASSSIGSNNIMRVDTTGVINYPLQCAILAVNSITRTDVTGDGTSYTIPFNSTIFDQNSDFNTGTGTFTAPRTGRYLLSAGVLLSQIAAGHNQLVLRIVTSNRTYEIFAANAGNMRDVNNNLICNGTVLADMDAADTATVSINVAGSTKTVDVASTGPDTFFSVYLAA